MVTGLPYSQVKMVSRFFLAGIGTAYITHRILAYRRTLKPPSHLPCSLHDPLLNLSKIRDNPSMIIKTPVPLLFQ